MKYFSTKIFDGYSTCFRQHSAEGTHCRFLHGYAISFKVTFEGSLDPRNWVFDFGGMKRAEWKVDGMGPSEYFTWLLDHTVLIAEDDPARKEFENLAALGVLQLRVLPQVGCERLAEHLFEFINKFLLLETAGRVRCTKVEVYEHPKNMAGVYA